MKREYYVTWTECRNKVTTHYILCGVYGNSVKEVRNRLVMEEQQFRMNNKKPFMFHLTVSAHRPIDAATRKKGHLYY